MIFSSLVSYYDRLAENDSVPPFGFSIEAIGFVITIDTKGNLIGEPKDLRTKLSANSYSYKQSVVPYSNKVNVRSSGAATTSNFIVDKADYIFGMSGTAKKEKTS